MRKLLGACLVVSILLAAPAADAQRRSPVTLVLVPGAGGPVPNDFLIRNIPAFQASGLETVVATSAGEAAAAASGAVAQGRKAVLVGMSAGTPTVAEAIAAGAPASGAIFVSGALMPPGIRGSSVVGALGSPARLPPTLVVHHRRDGCMMTPPEGVPEFSRWAGGRARVAWVDGGPPPESPPCTVMTPHGFLDQDRRPVAAIASFARAR